MGDVNGILAYSCKAVLLLGNRDGLPMKILASISADKTKWNIGGWEAMAHADEEEHHDTPPVQISFRVRNTIVDTLNSIR